MPARRLLALALVAVAFLAAPVQAGHEVRAAEAGPTPAPPISAAPEVKHPYFTITTYTVANVACVVRLNGVEVLRAEDPYTSGSMGSLNRWVVPGKNVLEVALSPLQHPKARPNEAQAAIAFSRVEAATPWGGWADEDVSTIFDYKAAVRPQRLKLPQVKRYEFEVPDAPPSELWAKAEPLTLDEATRAEAIARVRELAAAVTRRDDLALADLCAFQLAEHYRVDHREAPDLTALVAEAYPQDDPPLLPVDPAKLSFELAAGDRLLYVRGPKGREALVYKTASDDDAMEIPVYLARLGGKLVLVR